MKPSCYNTTLLLAFFPISFSVAYKGQHTTQTPPEPRSIYRNIADTIDWQR